MGQPRGTRRRGAADFGASGDSREGGRRGGAESAGRVQGGVRDPYVSTELSCHCDSVTVL